MADLFIRRFAKSEDRFLQIDFFILWWQPYRLRCRRHACRYRSGGAALQLDVCQTHGEVSMLWIVSEQPAIQMLVHDRSCNCEMQRRRAVLAHLLWIELCFDRWRVIDNL